MYEDVSYQTVLERMLGRVSDKFDKREGSVIFDALSPTALELVRVYIELERVLKEGYGDTASREFLVRRCSERGITPFPATKAVLKGVFAPAGIDVIGRRFSADTTNYVVTEKISDTEYQVQCETAGIVGNEQLGTIVPIEYIAGLESAELTEILIPGEDEEDTEDLRSRYFKSFDEKSFGGNKQDYLDKTNAIAGVGGVKVTRVWNSDIKPASLIPSDEVKEWYETISPTLDGAVGEWLNAVFTAANSKKLTTGGTVLLTIINSDYSAASETLVKTVQQTIDPEEYAGEGMGFAPIGHLVTVKSAEEVPIEVAAEIEFESGFDWDNLESTIAAAVADYLLELRREWADTESVTVRISRIETRLLAIKGIVDIADTKINGVPSNLTLKPLEIPVFGGVSH